VQGLPFAPPSASSAAARLDALFYFLLVSSVLITLGILLAIIYFVVRYRRRPGNEIAQRSSNTLPVELAWIVVMTLLAMVPFGWGAFLYLDQARPPADALEVYVVARQWMWKAQHQDGQAEIDELHVPVGRAVKLLMTSQDVIHDFSVPAFRVKQDVLPGRFTTIWFEATRAGEYHLFCAEYCGMDHSGMIGRIVALDAPEFETWLQSGAFLSPAAEGRKLFEQYGCAACHEGNRAPRLEGLFGRSVLLASGETVVADESYLRESIVNPGARVVYGFEPIMPSFSGVLDETQVIQLVTYIKSIATVPLPGSAAPR
jgi:cytochrome c oxidase subunit 2